MEPRTRNTCIVVAIVLLVLCCCVAAAGVVVVGRLTNWSYEWWWDTGPAIERQRIERSFAVGDAPSLAVDALAGSVTVRPGEEGTIQVAAIIKTSRSSDLDRIKVNFVERDGGLQIQVQFSESGFPIRNSSVDLEIVAPPDTRLDLETSFAAVDIEGFTGGARVVTGAGSITIRDVAGLIEATSDMGMVDVGDATGPVLLATKAGLVRYEGTPQGECRFETDLGAIEITLPDTPDVEIDAETDLGEVEVRCPVSGQVSSRQVKGVIGSGQAGTIRASSHVGAVSITCH